MAKSKQPISKRTSLIEKQKGSSLFDHINHIQKVQDPKYFEHLSDLDKKSFNHFQILRGLSMNPKLLNSVSMLFEYFDTLPSFLFYKILISIIPIDRSYYPWMKLSKPSLKKELIDLVATLFEVSSKSAIEYINLLFLSNEGLQSLISICRGFGKTDKEIEELLLPANDNDNY